MTEISTSQSSQFFGKDGLKPFIGVVEDVNDPKKAGRIKVRCVGWHPLEKKGANLPSSLVRVRCGGSGQNMRASEGSIAPWKDDLIIVVVPPAVACGPGDSIQLNVSREW